MPRSVEEHAVDEAVRLDDVRVVAVDSRKERRQVMRQLLERTFEPAEIAEADSRATAIELVSRCHPDLVVLEIQMPLREGLDTITDLAGMIPRPRIVVCSFLHDAATVVDARERGADAYVAKPAGSVDFRTALGAPLPERTVRHRPPNERPVSPPPFRSPAPAIGTETVT